MRAANIVTAVAGCLWLALFFLGRGLAYGVYAQRVVGFPNSGQIDYYVVFPLCLVTFLATTAWICNIFSDSRRALWSSLLLSLSVLSFGALFPYLLAYTGGM